MESSSRCPWRGTRPNSSHAFQRHEGHPCSAPESCLRLPCLSRKTATKSIAEEWFQPGIKTIPAFCDIPRYTSQKTQTLLGPRCHKQRLLSRQLQGLVQQAAGAGWAFRSTCTLTLPVEWPDHCLVLCHLHSESAQLLPIIFSVSWMKKRNLVVWFWWQAVSLNNTQVVLKEGSSLSLGDTYPALPGF